MKSLLDSPTRNRHFGPAQVDAADRRLGIPIARRAPASPGARLVAGRYRLRALLGHGGMGRVWLAEDELLHRPVALKQNISGDPASDRTHPAAAGRLLIEACAAASVSHKGAVTIYDVVTEDGRSWIVMEPLSGCTLAELVIVKGRLAIARVTYIGLRLLGVLMAAHRVGILHGDVKPANVYLCDDGRVVLIDFGIACSMLDEASNRTQIFAGSPLYTAPERLRGANPEPACDMFHWVQPCSLRWRANRHSAVARCSAPSLRSLKGNRHRACTPVRCELSSKDCSPRTPQTGSPEIKRVQLSWTCSSGCDLAM